jgi:predicted HicB family RNase H-like nuclease
MKKPSLSDALAKKEPSLQPAAPQKAAAPEPVAKPMDGKRATTLRIDPEQLEALKILAAKRRVKVNDLVLEGVEHVLALHAGKL